ncbi:MAG: sigma-70 family RNA polymerase sigma factor [Eubacteriaceae bacterium]|nr:sigma-70 family RNA polymerase sigma factor [Eubacteriaceae bacterium]
MDIFEEKFISDLKKGDKDAFNTVMNTYGTKVYNLIAGITSDREEAKDLTQETFIKVYNNLDRFNGNSSLYTWIYSIAANCARDYLRKKKDTISIEEVYHLRADHDDPQKNSQEKEELRLIISAVRKLDGEQKEAVILRDIMGFSYEEISQILQLTMGTVKSRIARGRYKLRENLAELRNNDLGGKDNGS